MILLLCLAGGLGALLRFVSDGVIRSWFGRRFPWGTIVINIIGSFLLGLVTGLTEHHHISSNYPLYVGVGFCGGYTTFSTSVFETVRLIEEKRYAPALLNTCITLGLALVAAALGIAMSSL